MKIHDSVGDLAGNKNFVAIDVHEMDADGKFIGCGYAGAGPVNGKAVGIDVGNRRLPETYGLRSFLKGEEGRCEAYEKKTPRHAVNIASFLEKKKTVALSNAMILNG